MTIESRVISSFPVELRSEGDGPPTVSGYAAVFYRADDPATQYELWPGAVERIMPEAFNAAIGRDDVRALFNHDPGALLGRKGAGTLKLSVDATGLRYEITPGVTTLHRDVAAMIQRGDIPGSSFSFQIDGPDVWKRSDDGTEVRELRNVRLFDVGPVTFPAYAGSSTEARSARDRLFGSIERERAQMRRQMALTQLTLFR